MIKNAELIEKLERQDDTAKVSNDWYKKADALFETAMSLNSDAVRQGGEQHVKMLKRVREKLKIIRDKISAK